MTIFRETLGVTSHLVLCNRTGVGRVPHPVHLRFRDYVAPVIDVNLERHSFLGHSFLGHSASSRLFGLRVERTTGDRMGPP